MNKEVKQSRHHTQHQTEWNTILYIQHTIYRAKVREITVYMHTHSCSHCLILYTYNFKRTSYIASCSEIGKQFVF